MTKKYRFQSIKGDHKEYGIYNSKAWRREAKIHYESSYELRKIARGIKNEISLLRKEGGTLDHDILKRMMRMRSVSKSSLLLIGYALEVVLKSGVISLFKDIPRKHISEVLKSKFSHKLIEIAEFIELPLDNCERELLIKMSNLVVADARYPIEPNDNKSFIFNRHSNKLSNTIFDEDFYQLAIGLYHKAWSHTERIRGTEGAPVSSGALQIDTDGIVAFRFGGGVSNRILICYSSIQRQEGENNSLKLWRLLESCVEYNQTLKVILNQGIDDIFVFELNGK